MQKIKLVLEDGSEKEFESGINALDIARDTGKELNNAIAIKLDGSILDLSAPIKKDGGIKFLTTGDKEGLSVLRHSTSHVMAAAVKELFPDVKVAIGPSIEEGFYYDFDKAEPFVPEDIEKIEAKMKEIINSNAPFVRKVLSKEEAIEFFTKKGEPYKVEIIKELPAETVSLYETGNFIDLCTGPHIPSTKKIKVYKLLNVAGAYWRGDEKKKMLQRIYGTAFNTREELKEFLTRREEAQKRDHRKLGKELDLY
ncbi:MAG: threonine--tRNA ligase, partial [Firmicutes bacterium]|nr:threonine--tRNA ligase [Bacillota bacterium]